jgi:hypothetical protein
VSAPLLKWDWDYLVHFAIGLGVTAAIEVGLYFASLPVWLAALMVPSATIAGMLREKQQHPIDPLTPHQWAEGLLFGAGSAVALVGLAVL